MSIHTKILTVILSGGTGSRLWPTSRKSLPKQFINFSDKGTLFFQTLLRGKQIDTQGKPIIISSKDYGFLCRREALKLSIKADYILEEIGRNTAPAIYFSSKFAIENYKNAILCFMPSDHWVEDDTKFAEMIKSGVELANDGNWVTFGIKPHEPNTGYGYINVQKNTNQAYDVISFEEKPDYKTAKAYLEKGNYFWNSGIFLVTAEKCLESFKKLQPELTKQADKVWNNRMIKNDESILLKSDLEKLTSISVDYAIMEQEKNVKLLPFNGEWSDVGSWDSLSKIISKTNSEKIVSKDNQVLIDSKNTFVHTTDRTIVGIGLEDLIVVDDDDATIISKKGETEKIKSALEILKSKNNKSSEEHTFEYRPWGKFENLLETEIYKVKRLTVDPGEHLSIQYHKKRSEHWVVVNGKASVQVNDKKLTLEKGQSIDIPKGSSHCLGNDTKENLVVIEVQLGDYFGEDDIVRISDPYDR